MSYQNRDFVEGDSERRGYPCFCRCYCNVGFGGYECPHNGGIGGSEGPNNGGNGGIGGSENSHNGGCGCNHNSGIGGSENNHNGGNGGSGGPNNGGNNNSNGRGSEVQGVQNIQSVQGAQNGELGRECRREIERFTRGVSELIGSSKSSQYKLYNGAHKHTAEAIYALDSIDKLSKEARSAYEVLYSQLEDSGCADEWNYETRRCRHYIRDARSYFAKSAEERQCAEKNLKSALNNIEDAKAYSSKAFAALGDFRNCISDDEDDCHGHHHGHGREFD